MSNTNLLTQKGSIKKKIAGVPALPLAAPSASVSVLLY